MNRHRYAEHRIPTSLERHVGRSADAGTVEALARKANRETKLTVFTEAMLDSLEPYIRTIIEGAARRFDKGRG